MVGPPSRQVNQRCSYCVVHGHAREVEPAAGRFTSRCYTPPHARSRIRRALPAAGTAAVRPSVIFPSLGDLAGLGAGARARLLPLRPPLGGSSRPSALAGGLPRAARLARHGGAGGHRPHLAVGAPPLWIHARRRREHRRLDSLAPGARPGVKLARRGAPSPPPSRLGPAVRGGGRGG